MDKFSFDTVQNFDEHLLKSIPNYDLLFDSITRISDYFLDATKTVYDLGCSTGKLIHYLRDEKKFKGRMVGIDYSNHLLPGLVKCENIEFMQYDLNDYNNIKFENACIIYAIFTLQFLKRENRQRLLNKIYYGLKEGGAFILAEKVYAKHSIIQDIYTFSYYDYKRNTFSEKEILNKEKDLRSILKPNSSETNIEMLYGAGFSTIEMMYKYFNFECYLCIKNGK